MGATPPATIDARKRRRVPFGKIISSASVGGAVGTKEISGVLALCCRRWRIFTSSNFAGSRHCTSKPRLCSRVQPKIRLALTPCLRATSATENPGCCASSTIATFSAFVRMQRTPPGRTLDVVVISVEVSICVSSGHFILCHSSEGHLPQAPTPTTDGGDRTVTLNRDSVNTRTHRRLADRERIVRVVLLVLGKGLHVLRQDNRDAKASLEQIPAPKARRRTRFHRISVALGSSSSTPKSLARNTFRFHAIVPSTDNAQTWKTFLAKSIPTIEIFFFSSPHVGKVPLNSNRAARNK